MSVTKQALSHAGGRYRKVFGFVSHPVKGIEDEAHHLHEIERAGDSGETPFIAMLGLVIFLIPIFLVILGLAVAAARLFS